MVFGVQKFRALHCTLCLVEDRYIARYLVFKKLNNDRVGHEVAKKSAPVGYEKDARPMRPKTIAICVVRRTSRDAPARTRPFGEEEARLLYSVSMVGLTSTLTFTVGD